MYADQGCAERGCPMVDRGEIGVEMVPKRQWVGLTDEECNTIGRHHAYVGNIIKATESKLKEKNSIKE